MLLFYKILKGQNIKQFEKLNIHPHILKVVEEVAYENPTAIQKRVIPLATKGRDLIGASKSGTGKTAAYLFPLLGKTKKLLKPENRVIRSIILVPTRDLVDQVSAAIAQYGKYLKLKQTKIQGGVPKALQLEKLKGGMDIIVATTGRLKAFIQEGKIDLSNVSTVVLDEADTMLEMGFKEEFEFILSHCSSKKQIMMFSATISQNIRKLGKEYLKNPETIEVSERRDTVSLIQHKAYKVDVKRKKELLKTLLLESPHNTILIFVNSKEEADSLTAYLKNRKLDVEAIHGDIDFKIRSESIRSFKKGSLEILVATDIAGRGLDIQGLPLVVNFELPEKTDEFTHRVGRTGRAGKKGEVLTILTTTEYRHFSKIERDLKLGVKREVHPDFPLTDRQPRQKAFIKKSAIERKKQQQRKSKKAPKQPAKSKKTTKRDPRR